MSEASRRRNRESARRNREKVNARSAEWKKANKHKVRAHNAVIRARKSGELIRPDKCSKCNKICTPQAHHHDYDKPLDVEWLCSVCHVAEHGGPPKINVIRGEKCRFAKFKEEDVRIWKTMLLSGTTVKEVMRISGMSETATRDLKNGTRWKHI